MARLWDFGTARFTAKVVDVSTVVMCRMTFGSTTCPQSPSSSTYCDEEVVQNLSQMARLQASRCHHVTDGGVPGDGRLDSLGLRDGAHIVHAGAGLEFRKDWHHTSLNSQKPGDSQTKLSPQ